MVHNHPSCVPIFSVQVVCNHQHDLTTTMKTEAMANIMNSKIKTFYNASILMTTNENILQCIYFGKKWRQFQQKGWQVLDLASPSPSVVLYRSFLIMIICIHIYMIILMLWHQAQYKTPVKFANYRSCPFQGEASSELVWSRWLRHSKMFICMHN